MNRFLSLLSEAARLRPRIGITGSFGRGNFGDELFVKTHEHYLSEISDLHLLTGLPHPYYLRDFGTRRVELMDYIVIGGGDLICPYRVKLDQDFVSKKYLHRPVYMVGIGVENNKPVEEDATMEKWRQFLTHPNMKRISARDTRSQRWLEEKIFDGNDVPVHPDIVLACPLPQVKKPAKKFSAW